jgi:phospholipase C
LAFIEDNWKTGRIGNSSFDLKAGSLGNLFNFSDSGNATSGSAKKLFLDPSTGLPSKN